MNKVISKYSVIKFSGSAISSENSLEHIEKIIQRAGANGRSTIIVISAIEKLTDQLSQINKNIDNKEAASAHLDEALNILKNFLSKAPKLLSELEKNLINELMSIKHEFGKARSEELKARILGIGEIISTKAIYEMLNNRGIKSVLLKAEECIQIRKKFQRNIINIDATAKKLTECLAPGNSVFLISGFIGCDDNKNLAILERGGSDHTLAAIAEIVGASSVEVYTNTSGFMSADPEKVSNCYQLSHLSYNEALELSHYGAHIVATSLLKTAIRKNFEIYVTNIKDTGLNDPTVISNRESQSDKIIKGISSISNVSLFKIDGSKLVSDAQLFEHIVPALEKANINILLLTSGSSYNSISIAVAKHETDKAESVLKLAIADLEIQPSSSIEKLNEVSIISIVGENMRLRPGVSGKFFSVLGRNGINILAISQGSSELNITVAITKKDEHKALNAVHDAFLLSETKTINLFLLGHGQIGKELLRQINNQSRELLDRLRLNLKIVLVANSKKFIFNESGFDFKDVHNLLEKSDLKFDLNEIIKSISAANLPSSIFIDCTASEKVACSYIELIKSNISIVTPNKKANSSSIAEYKSIKEALKRSNSQFYYETNVGAGLPVINTLNDLILSGDSIISIEGVLSGTLSYIFNNFKEGTKFSDILLNAKDQGYTEPDPRDDLSGLDVGRKILILARELGLNLDLEDISIENLVPAALQNLSVDEFLNQIQEYDIHFDKLLQESTIADKKLRYVANLSSNSATVKLVAVSNDHPLATLDGSDNMICFTTQRYNKRPLVIRGPGAGVEVTAAGVFADILRASSYL